MSNLLASPSIDPYDARSIVRDVESILDDWREKSKMATRAVAYQADIATAGCPFDLYLPPARELPAPVVIFVHGGYWRAGTARESGFLAPQFAKAGLATAVPDYPLAPQVSLGAIVEATVECILWITQQAASLGIDPQRIALIGHSAGGHLGAMALARYRRSSLPRPRVLLGISGLYDVVPVSRSYASDWLDLSDEEALRLSPISHRPCQETRIELTAGSLETDAFRAQSVLYRDFARDSGCDANFRVSPGCNHFDIIHQLLNPDHMLFRQLLDSLAP